MKNTLLLLLTLFICSFTTDFDTFEIVIKNQSSEIIKNKLKTYKSEGIERPLRFEAINDSSKKVDIELIISTAKSYLGTKHQMGGTSKSGIDCSGLVMMSLKSAGIDAPHISHEQGRYGRIIPLADSLKRGDLVFFIQSYNTNNLISHAGIFLGKGKFIHASAKTGVVITDMKDAYWKPKFVFGTRISE